MLIIDIKKNIKNGYISSFKCFEGENIYNIILLENFPCNNKNELLKREGYYIKNLDCVNKKLPIKEKNINDININIDDEIDENNLYDDDEIKKLKIELDLLKNNKIQIPEQILKTEKIIHIKQKLNVIEFKLDCINFDIIPYDKKKGNI